MSVKLVGWLPDPVPAIQLVSDDRWHVSQAVANPAAAWFGLVVFW